MSHHVKAFRMTVLVLLIIVVTAGILARVSSPITTLAQANEPPSVFYVSRLGNNSSGSSWATAWCRPSSARAASWC